MSDPRTGPEPDIKPASPDKPKNATTDWGRDYATIQLHNLANVISDTAGLSRPSGNHAAVMADAERAATKSGKPVLVYQLAGVYESREVEVPTAPVVGNTYNTRGGQRVKVVHRYANASMYPVFGIVIDINGKLLQDEIVDFTGDGRVYHDRDGGLEDSLDLICTRRERKFGFWPAERTQ